MTKRILIAVGGTAGHVNPAMALARSLKKKYPHLYIFFAGGGLKENRYFDRQAFPYEDIMCGSVPFKKPIKCIIGLTRTSAGFIQSIGMLLQQKPDLIVGFGSYHTFPILMAARFLSIPYILHESNSIPGKVNRLLSKHALVTGVQFPVAGEHLKGKSVQVDMPLKVDLEAQALSPQEARKEYGMDSAKFTILVFGGSQGAATLNRLLPETFCSYSTDIKAFQVIHFTGDPQRNSAVRKRYQDAGIEACVKDYEQRMAIAWRAADLVVARAGAGTISEQIEFDVPGILIPYPHSADNHQEKNADFMAKQVGGALKLMESDASPQKLAALFTQLVGEQRRILSKMQESIREYKQNTHSQDMCALISSSLKD